MNARMPQVLVALVVAAGTNGSLTACYSIPTIDEKSAGEPEQGARFVVTSLGNDYQVTRWYPSDARIVDTFSVPRSAVPAGCESARFFLGDPSHELAVAQPQDSSPLKAERPPLPDDQYPPCSLLVSYGAFSAPPALDGVAVTGAGGLVATDERRPSHPGYWLLAPPAVLAETWGWIGAMVASPVIVAGGVAYAKNQASEEKEARAKAEAALPLPVVACWRVAEPVEVQGEASAPGPDIAGFHWTPDANDSYVVTEASDAFAEDNQVAIDSRVTLRRGRIALRFFNFSDDLSTDADVECGMNAGEVVASRARLRP